MFHNKKLQEQKTILAVYIYVISIALVKATDLLFGSFKS